MKKYNTNSIALDMKKKNTAVIGFKSVADYSSGVSS
jgi:hypothetical protein